MSNINDTTINGFAEKNEPVQRTKTMTTKGYLGFHRLYSNGVFVGWAEMCDCYNEQWAVYNVNKTLVGKTYTPLNDWSRIAKLIGA